MNEDVLTKKKIDYFGISTFSFKSGKNNGVGELQ